MNRIQSYLNGQPATGNALGTASAVIGQDVQSQATILGYIDVFFVLALVAGLMVPLALSLRAVNRNTGAMAAH